jgi:hypothetical protein
MTTEIVTRPEQGITPGSEAGTYALATLSDADFDARLDSLKKGRERIAAIQKKLMRPGVDYGKIPGTGDRPTLLKPGAEKLADFYRFAAGMAASLSEGDDEKTPAIRYEVRCTLHLGTLDGPIVATGWGVCTSWEKKYRYRKEWYTTASGKRESRQAPNNDPWEQANTILKIAEKRAFIDAVLRATASSGLFTQDVGDEDIPESSPRRDPQPVDDLPALPAAPNDVLLRNRYEWARSTGWNDEQLDEHAIAFIGKSVMDMDHLEWQVFATDVVKAGPIESAADVPAAVEPGAGGSPSPAPAPPKPRTPEYGALSAQDKATARAYWAQHAEQEGLGLSA